MNIKKIIIGAAAVIIALLLTATAASAETFKLTAYCNCVKCCGKWAKYNKTASGTTPVAGRTIAVDRKVIPLGTKVIIDGHEYTAEDTGVKGNTIDIFFNSHSEALKFGVQYKDVKIVTAAEEAEVEVENVMPPAYDFAWIPIENETPPDLIEVLVTIEEVDENGVAYDSYVKSGWHDGNIWRAGDELGVHVIAWAWLPSPYVKIPVN